MHHASIRTANIHRAIAFYEQLGFSVSDRFTAGLGTHMEVTNAQTSVALARDNHIEALFRFSASQINLARAKGEIENFF